MGKAISPDFLMLSHSLLGMGIKIQQILIFASGLFHIFITDIKPPSDVRSENNKKVTENI